MNTQYASQDIGKYILPASENTQEIRTLFQTGYRNLSHSYFYFDKEYLWAILG